MAVVIPIHPARRAVDELKLLGRMDLRRQAVKVVVSEVQAGRDGMSVMRQIADTRRQSRREGGAA